MAHSVESIFAEALRQPDAVARAAFVTSACGEDAALRARVEALLTAHDRAGSFMSRPASAPSALPAVTAPDEWGLDAATAAAAPPGDLLPEGPGSVIGHYKLLQRIGEGGFGTVWMADQERPVRRRVALKIIKAGMDTKQVIARFEQERQALALMDHPNIAKVLDAGATSSGRPYFVMELVRGVKITDYCDQQALPTVERIKLFITVCHAIQHAHQKGVIHRDLKPSNILVTVNDGEAVPKVIDFGVAKATQGRLIDGTLFTQFEQMIGTPLYMSPEQAEITSLDVDTRSDVYSLGVLLYELLTGRTPIDNATLAKAGLDEVRRLIREVDPPRPSARLGTLAGDELTTVAKRRHADPAKLPAALRGDLDWIVMKCLEKDRRRRYDTANGLATDLQRHLRNDVVLARPPTTAYLLSKLFRRNKLVFATGAAVAASLVIGIALTAWQAIRATRAERRTAATLEELRETVPAFAEQARALATREQFDEAVRKLDYALKLRPDAPELLVAKGDLLQCQFKLADAGTVYRRALKVDPSSERAKSSAALCDELLAAPTAPDGKLSRESLARLHVAMQKQQRPAAEMLPVARLLGQEKNLVVAYWLERLKDLPVSPKNPLAKRLTVREDGGLALDLSDSRVVDLSLLAGAPLSMLDLTRCSELTDLSPLAGMDIVELSIAATGVSDLRPLGSMRRLERLNMNSTRVSDLAPLSGLRLKTLDIAGCPVYDLGPLRTLPLEDLNLTSTRVGDLSPLAGMPVRQLNLTRTPVSDFSPLATLPLEKCYLQQTRITDLAVFRGRPLKELVLWGCVDARNYAALRDIPSLELLLLPSIYRALPAEEYAAIGALRDHPALRQIGSDAMAGMDYGSTASKEVFWQDWDREQAFVPALRNNGIVFSLQKLPAGTYHLAVQQQPLRDLSVLRGAPISSLFISGCPVSDLSPLRDLPLHTLHLEAEAVADVRPLRGMPLKTLILDCPNVSDLSPLAGLPLRELYVEGCVKVADVAPLAQVATLEKLTVPVNASNVESLRRLPRIQMLAFNRLNTNRPASTADDFWKDYEWISRARRAGLTGGAIERLDDGTWRFYLPENAGIRDIGALRDAPISHLVISRNPVADIGPLRGMRLKMLVMYASEVRDISPLEGMPLDFLWLHAVSDLSVLRGMPVKALRLHTCPDGTDLGPLAECAQLVEVTLPPGARNVEALRRLPRLERISYRPDFSGRPDKSAATFWKDYDSWRPTSAPSVVPAETLAVLSEQSVEKPDDTLLAMRVATLQAWLGRDDEYAAHCRRMLEWAKGTDSAEIANRVAKLSCLRPDADPSRRRDAVALARKGVELGKGSPKAPWHQLALGMAEYRAGRFSAAVETLALASQDALSVPGTAGPNLQCAADLYRAMGLSRLGRAAEAQDAFTAAEQRMTPYPSNEDNPVAEAADQNDLIVWLAYKEAKAMLGEPDKVTAKASKVSR